MRSPRQLNWITWERARKSESCRASPLVPDGHRLNLNNAKKSLQGELGKQLYTIEKAYNCHPAFPSNNNNNNIIIIIMIIPPIKIRTQDRDSTGIDSENKYSLEFVNRPQLPQTITRLSLKKKRLRNQKNGYNCIFKRKDVLCELNILFLQTYTTRVQSENHLPCAKVIDVELGGLITLLLLLRACRTSLPFCCVLEKGDILIA